MLAFHYIALDISFTSNISITSLKEAWKCANITFSRVTCEPKYTLMDFVEALEAMENWVVNSANE